MKQDKYCYIVAGANGAGKTTFALNYLKQLTDCSIFVNADMIASGISPLSPESVQLQASKIYLNTIKKRIEKEQSFAFETTLSGKSYLKTLNKMKSCEWQIILIYLWIPSIVFSKKRVEERVKTGGHNIPIEAIERRYSKSLYNLFNFYMPIADYTLCFNNSGPNLEQIFEKDSAGINIINENIYNEMRRYGNG